jgi:hypothetical protein
MSIKILAIAALVPLLHAAPAGAQIAYVSAHGSDANPCTLTQPCRHFQRAHDQTAAGGEVTVLDTADYGLLTISKAISVTAPDGIEAQIMTTAPGDAITVNAGTGDVVNLRGLTLSGGGVGNNGISFTSGGALRVQHCVIRGFTNGGLVAQPSGDSSYMITDTVISDIPYVGILIAPTGRAGATALLKRVQLLRIVGKPNASAFALSAVLTNGAVFGSVSDTSASDSRVGFEVDGFSSQLIIDRSEIINNQFGLAANQGLINLGNSSMVANERIANGLIYVCSYGNNRVSGNGSNFFCVLSHPLKCDDCIGIVCVRQLR